MNLIDGYNGGIPHIEADMIRDHNIAMYGSGDYVLPVGNKFEASIKSNNAVTVKDGMAIIGGARVNISYGQTEQMTIENGTSGYYRKDLIVIEYTKNENGVENAVLKVVKGSLASSAAAANDPAVVTGNIRAGATKHQMVLHRVNINGLSIASIDTIYVSAGELVSSEVIADTWNETKTYAKGAYVMYNGSLYQCLVQNSGQTPTNSTYWTSVKIGDKGLNIEKAIFDTDAINLKVNVETVALTAPDRSGIWYASNAPGSMPSGFSHWGILINLRSPYSLHPTSANAVYVQVYIDVLNRRATRAYNNGSWTAWKEF